VLLFRNFLGCLCNFLFEKYIITQYKFIKQTIENFNQLKFVYNDKVLSYSTGAHWGALFKNGRESIEDEPRSGRPVTGVIKTKFEAEIKR
jgi:hypothetical protein